ncbi:hypothetical protein B0H12DRAFT_705948 [Mycena haematopus]|nr:hypothetical protein B0H12DRAFT_705948 [Mycena haematopus]
MLIIGCDSACSAVDELGDATGPISPPPPVPVPGSSSDVELGGSCSSSGRACAGSDSGGAPLEGGGSTPRPPRPAPRPGPRRPRRRSWGSAGSAPRPHRVGAASPVAPRCRRVCPRGSSGARALQPRRAHTLLVLRGRGLGRRRARPRPGGRCGGVDVQRGVEERRRRDVHAGHGDHAAPPPGVIGTCTRGGGGDGARGDGRGRGRTFRRRSAGGRRVGCVVWEMRVGGLRAVVQSRVCRMQSILQQLLRQKVSHGTAQNNEPAILSSSEPRALYRLSMADTSIKSLRLQSNASRFDKRAKPGSPES